MGMCHVINFSIDMRLVTNIYYYHQHERRLICYRCTLLYLARVYYKFLNITIVHYYKIPHIMKNIST